MSKLYLIRKQISFSQKLMGMYLGVSRSTVARIERGHPINARILEKLDQLEIKLKINSEKLALMRAIN